MSEKTASVFDPKITWSVVITAGVLVVTALGNWYDTRNSIALLRNDLSHNSSQMQSQIRTISERQDEQRSEMRVLEREVIKCL
ncbi:MAG: hypothetical protein ABW168_00475 [Sedimenticola sp.]